MAKFRFTAYPPLCVTGTLDADTEDEALTEAREMLTNHHFEVELVHDASRLSPAFSKKIRAEMDFGRWDFAHVELLLEDGDASA